MSELRSVAEVADLVAVIDAALERFREEHEIVLAIDRGTTDGTRFGEPRWYVRMAGEEKDVITVWLTLGQRTLRYETYVLPAPEENVSEFNEQLLRDLMTYCRHNPIHEILALPDVQERVEAYWYHKEFGERQIKACSKLSGRTLVTDLRGQDVIHAVDRFLIYAIFPECDLSVTLRASEKPGITEIACGKSIFMRTSKVNVGSLMLKHGGGGHAAAGTCRVPDSEVDAVIDDILAEAAGQAA